MSASSDTTVADFADDYMSVIVDSIVNQPRSLQRRIGPSEMGIECNRAILHKLNGDDEPARADIPWKPTIGTAVHAYLEEAFGAAKHNGRWLIEQRVEVGEVAGVKITGSADLFDQAHGAVLDHKIVGRSTLKGYRAHGPSEQYRRQAHLYGRGFAAAGHNVKWVTICFLPREGELADSVIWSEPYDENLALETIARVDGLARLLAILGIDKAIELYPACSDRWCRWCGSGSSFGRQSVAATTAELFAN